MHYVTLSASYLGDNELEGKRGWQEPGQAGESFLYVSVNHFSDVFKNEVMQIELDN